MENNQFKNIILSVLILFTTQGLYCQTFVSSEGIERRKEVIDFLNKWKNKKVIGKDTTGAKAAFQILVLSQDENWRFADTRNIESGPIERVLPRYLRLKVNLLKKVDEIICVGTASVQGESEVEAKRAQLRAKRIAKTVKKFNRKNQIYKKLHVLNLGKFKEVINKQDLQNQRPVIIIGIVKLSKGKLNLEYALQDALMKVRHELAVDMRSYDNFNNLKLARYR